LEQRLDTIAVWRLLRDGCKMTAAALSGMSAGQLAALVAESLVSVLAAAVAEAVHPGGGGQGEGRSGGEGEAAAATSRGKYRQTLSDVIGAADPSRSWRWTRIWRRRGSSIRTTLTARRSRKSPSGRTGTGTRRGR
jgi:hypothetical protein